MRKNEFRFLSNDSYTKIHAIEWIPDGEVKAVLQICHGMVEYIDRYDEFANYLAERGYYVVGHDHLGHGKSVRKKEDYGFFHEKNGNQYVVGDIDRLRKITQKKYSDIPYFMLGHSMGSFLLRQYLTMNSEGLAGAVIMGTGYQPTAVVAAGQIVCKAIAIVKGWHYRSRFVNNLSFGSFNKKFEPAETSKDWITSDKKKRDEYVKDPLTNFVFTVNGYYHMFEGMKQLEKKDSVDKIAKSLPVFFVAGAEDPVGEFGRGVAKIYKRYKDAGIQDVKMKLYLNDRHEILNEVNREQVYEDLYQWFERSL